MLKIRHIGLKLYIHAKRGAVALGEARKLQASYGDVRIVRIFDPRTGLRPSPERGTGKKRWGR